MTTPLDLVRDALATTPREREYLELFTDGWSQADRDAARALLVDAARAGDWRVPAVLWTVASPDELRAALESLLQSGQPRVRVEAGHELLKLTRDGLVAALDDAIVNERLDRHGLMRAVDLLLAAGGEAHVAGMLDRAAAREDVRTVLIERLWDWRQYDLVTSPWWTGMGLLRRTLTLELPSFRGPAVERLKALLGSMPIVLGYQPVAMAPIPAALRAAMNDIDGGSGPVDESLLAPLGDDERRALLVYAADVALHRDQPRGVLYVGRIGGREHRDLLEWAAASRLPAYAHAGAEALQTLGGA